MSRSIWECYSAETDNKMNGECPLVSVGAYGCLTVHSNDLKIDALVDAD